MCNAVSKICPRHETWRCAERQKGTSRREEDDVFYLYCKFPLFSFFLPLSHSRTHTHTRARIRFTQTLFCTELNNAAMQQISQSRRSRVKDT